MARSDWFDDSKDMPVIDEQMSKLEHFVTSMADGIIENRVTCADRRSHSPAQSSAIEKAAARLMRIAGLSRPASIE